MTFHTKAATDEIYEMFNQSLKADSDEESSNGYSDDDDNNDNVEEEDEDEEEDENFHHNQGSDEDDVMSKNDEQQDKLSNHSSQQQLGVNTLSTPIRNYQPHYRKSRMPAMTPIAEATETTTSPHSPIIKKSDQPPQLINPAHESVRESVWTRIKPILDAAGVYKRVNFNYNKADSIKKALRMIKAGDKFSSKAQSNLIIQFPGVEDIFCLKRILGEGAFGSVYLAESGSGQWKAIKVESAVLPWEFYSVLTAQERLVSSRDFQSIIGVDALYSFDDEQYMILDFASQGTILDLVNMANSISEGNQGLEEIVAMFFTVEMLRVMQSLHMVGIIHGDIKPDNIMVRLPEDSDDSWDKHYRRDGGHNWNEKGIVLVDFGRSIDTGLFPTGTQYIADWDIDQEQDCLEMRNNQPWSYQTDYHGLAGVIHLLLFGKFLKTQNEVIDGETILRLATPFKRYWQRDLWNQLFECLLNSSLAASKLGYQNLPLNSHLATLRKQFEDFLEQKSEGQGISLKSSLIRLQQELKERRRK